MCLLEEEKKGWWEREGGGLDMWSMVFGAWIERASGMAVRDLKIT